VAVDQDNRQAAFWYYKAAKQDIPEALFNLSQMYYAGEDVIKDSKKSFEYCKRAAELGHVDAQTNLGVTYATGDGCAKDYIQAYRWSIIASESGSATSNNTLANLDRLITPSDKKEAQRLVRHTHFNLERIKTTAEKRNSKSIVPASPQDLLCKDLEKGMMSKYLELGLTPKHLKVDITYNENDSMMVCKITGSLSIVTDAKESLEGLLTYFTEDKANFFTERGFKGLKVMQNYESASHTFD